MPRLVPGPNKVEPPIAPPPRHDELSELAAAVVRGESAALRTFLATIVPQLLRVVRRVLGSQHPDLEDITIACAASRVAEQEEAGALRVPAALSPRAARAALRRPLAVR